ncbi:putative ubiquitin hydrolase, putative,cysteine peptidase, Clan CA, family C19 [Trypanosoma grayi]|uniref:putative ubiquitin hydrolase, putative,cysteine peptidase, Clan CA, family C19 n=1 Tax=Trypanosoma grayi TaxID=71804 RepID=UPI0004F4840B|nr:putative ubiquitin hydrolase, putative,cysteine peptidase, Clan CA, family C19 [Trypanosoma grayi]KEG11912.1 putative ubiquitin hydrolase, putative,cysteine peptidase, Clan CA, family C19 [Trypanosoma grayi]
MGAKGSKDPKRERRYITPSEPVAPPHQQSPLTSTLLAKSRSPLTVDEISFYGTENNNNKSKDSCSSLAFSRPTVRSPGRESSSGLMEDGMRPSTLPVAATCASLPIPTYKSEGMLASPSTPMLRSYHMHSVSPLDKGMMGSPSSNASSAAPALPIHTRFLEINGYPAGLENYGNTCYCNAVLQLFYHCSPLRLRLLEVHKLYAKGKGRTGFEEDTVLALVADLFAKMHKASNSKKLRKEVIAPKQLLTCVQNLNPMFDSKLQHDAHEFAMFVLNSMIEMETRMMTDKKNCALFFDTEGGKSPKWPGVWRRSTRNGSSGVALSEAVELREDAVELPLTLRMAGSSDALDVRSAAAATAAAVSTGTLTDSSEAWDRKPVSPLQTIFGGQFASVTACFECEHVTVMREAFVDLSLDIEQGSSLRQCMANFSAPELFHGTNKLYCDHCGRKVTAEKFLRVHRLPEYALLIHLKRFQYDEKMGGMTKKSVHVALPRELDVVEYEPWAEDNDGSNNQESWSHNDKEDISQGAASPVCDPPKPSSRLAQKLKGVVRRKGRFALSGFVTHVGEGPNLGHYFTCVRHGELWRRFDDTAVTELTEREMRQYWGVPVPLSSVITATAYILLYERVA